MGHANFENISRVVNRLAKRPLGATIRQCVDHLERKGATVHTSEGEYADRGMLSDACEEIMHVLLQEGHVVAHPASPKQKEVLRNWRLQETDLSGDGEHGESGQYAVLDSIKFTALTNKLPVIRYFSR